MTVTKQLIIDGIPTLIPRGRNLEPGVTSTTIGGRQLKTGKIGLHNIFVCSHI